MSGHITLTCGDQIINIIFGIELVLPRQIRTFPCPLKWCSDRIVFRKKTLKFLNKTIFFSNFHKIPIFQKKNFQISKKKLPIFQKKNFQFSKKSNFPIYFKFSIKFQFSKKKSIFPKSKLKKSSTKIFILNVFFEKSQK